MQHVNGQKFWIFYRIMDDNVSKSYGVEIMDVNVQKLWTNDQKFRRCVLKM